MLTPPFLVAVAPGPMTTIQDRGRVGWKRFGVSTCGAMDLGALSAANALVGNDLDAAAVEFAYSGGEWELRASSARIAITGGRFASFIDNRPIPDYQSVRLFQGQRLRIQGAPDAVWGYLAVAQGFAVSPQLGSVSTHLRSRIGGFEGRTLRHGDYLPLTASEAAWAIERELPREPPAPEPMLRVVLGPQEDYFATEALEALLSNLFEVTREGDRMGVQLFGPPLRHARGFNIVSDGVVAGSIQVPGTCQPIVLLRDHQPTGGYPKIATVISADLDRLVQCRPGQRVRFTQVDLAEAQRARGAYFARLEGLKRAACAVASPFARRRSKWQEVVL